MDRGRRRSDHRAKPHAAAPRERAVVAAACASPKSIPDEKTMDQSQAKHLFDVIVVGGGTAGSNAAIASGCLGARTCLVEGAGYLGGTCLALANVIPFHNTRGERIVGGLPHEIIDRLIERDGARRRPHLPNPTGIGGSFTPVDPDCLKALLFEMADKAGVELWLHTIFVDSLMTDNRISGVRVHNKSGFTTFGGA